MLSLISLLLTLISFLPQTFTVVGNVRDQNGRSVPGVRVSVYDENFQPIRTLFVDSSGQFWVRRLGPGRYQFRVETTGTPYREYDSGWIELQSLRVRGGGTEMHQLDIILQFKTTKAPATSSKIIFAQNVPAPARREYKRGIDSLTDNQQDTAITCLKKALEIFPDYFDALELLGTEYVKGGQYSVAIPVLRRAIEINHRAPRSLYALGVAQMKLDHHPEAIESLKKSAEFEPDNVNTQMMLGLALGHQQLFDESATAFKKALQLGGASVAEAHFYLAGVYDKQARYNDAARELELYLKEAKDISDRERVRKMIEALKTKARSKK